MDKNKIIKFTDYKNVETIEDIIPKKTKTDKKPVVQSLFKWLIGVIVSTFITVFMTVIVPYYSSPRHTDIHTRQLGMEYGQLDVDSELCNIFYKSSVPEFEIYLDNNNDSFIRITDICVNVINYEYITEKDIIYRPDVGGSGALELPIYLKANIEPHVGTMKTEIDFYSNLKYDGKIIDESNEYIEIVQNSSDKFIMSLHTSKQGYYKIEVEFRYIYHGKTYTIKTPNYEYIFLEINYSDSQLYQLNLSNWQ